MLLRINLIIKTGDNFLFHLSDILKLVKIFSLFVGYIETGDNILFHFCPIPQVTAIGKLDIVWRTSLCDRGRLQTSQLQRLPPR